MASFQKGIKRLIEMVSEIDAIPMLGGLYPCQFYNATHYKWLKDMQQQLDSFKVTVFDFLSAVDDGKGHWKQGTFFDAGNFNSTSSSDVSLGHPNDLGHK